MNGLESSGAADGFNCRFIGMIRAAGMNEVSGVFEILDALPQILLEKRLSTKSEFESGIRKFHTKDYAGAAERFKAVLAADPSDPCAANALRETEQRLANPELPAVFTFEVK
jgi:hypothetical protein